MEIIKESVQPITKNLEKDEGPSLEDIVKFLDNKVSKAVIYSSNEGDHYIRDHVIILNSIEYMDHQEKLQNIGGSISCGNGPIMLEFVCYHKPTNKFDFSKLHGLYEFNKGRLIERTRIRPPDPFNPDEGNLN